MDCRFIGTVCTVPVRYKDHPCLQYRRRLTMQDHPLSMGCRFHPSTYLSSIIDLSVTSPSIHLFIQFVFSFLGMCMYIWGHDAQYCTTYVHVQYIRRHHQHETQIQRHI